jgi:hypothetical protein
VLSYFSQNTAGARRTRAVRLLQIINDETAPGAQQCVGRIVNLLVSIEGRVVFVGHGSRAVCQY